MPNKTVEIYSDELYPYYVLFHSMDEIEEANGEYMFDVSQDLFDRYMQVQADFRAMQTELSNILGVDNV